MSIVQAITLLLIMVGLAALPSSSVALVIARTTSHGLMHGLAVTIGIVLGDLVFIFLAILGLAAIAEAIGPLFMIIKLLGGAYLIWLGVTLFKSKNTAAVPRQTEHSKKGVVVSLIAGFFLTLGDIKAILFYASLFPMMVDLPTATTFDIALIVGITVFSIASAKLAYAVMSQRIVRFSQSRGWGGSQQRLVGGLLMGAGGYVIYKAS